MVYVGIYILLRINVSLELLGEPVRVRADVPPDRRPVPPPPHLQRELLRRRRLLHQGPRPERHDLAERVILVGGRKLQNVNENCFQLVHILTDLLPIRCQLRAVLRRQRPLVRPLHFGIQRRCRSEDVVTRKKKASNAQI